MKSIFYKTLVLGVFFFTSLNFAYLQSKVNKTDTMGKTVIPYILPTDPAQSKEEVDVKEVIEDAKKTVEEYNKTVEEKNKIVKEVTVLTKQEIENGKKINTLIKKVIKKYKQQVAVVDTNVVYIEKDNPIRIDTLCTKERKPLFSKDFKCTEEEITFYIVKNKEKVILQKLITKK